MCSPAGDICQFNSFIHFLISNFSFSSFFLSHLCLGFFLLLSSPLLFFCLWFMPHWSLCAPSTFHHISPTLLHPSSTPPCLSPINQAGHRVSAPCSVLDPWVCVCVLVLFSLCSSAWHTNKTVQLWTADVSITQHCRFRNCVAMTLKRRLLSLCVVVLRRRQLLVNCKRLRNWFEF